MTISFQSLGMLRTKVKVSQITNLSEARYCAGMGVDFLSFPISSIDSKTFKEITSWVAGPKFGIEVDLNNIDRVNEYEADFIQLPFDLLDHISVGNVAVPLIHLHEWSLAKTKLISLKSQILFLEIVDSPLNPKEELVLHEMANDFELVMHLSNASEIDRILNLPIAGIRLEGGAEQRPGLKDYPLAEILETLEHE
ncbi:MAG TPA: hypothetical protein DGG95_11035 [Cytophagales bacterium]|jgi:phosphoribosylanthranilate isomerase|nr:hypothetical protein [Cytophagales bacterium]